MEFFWGISSLIAGFAAIFVGFMFFGADDVSFRGKIRAGLVCAGLVGYIIWVFTGPMMAIDEAFRAAREEHNLRHCVVQVEGREYRPIAVSLPSRSGVGSMTLASGERIRFLGGTVGGGCK